MQYLVSSAARTMSSSTHNVGFMTGHTVHQRVERLLRSQVMLVSVLGIMAMGILKLDSQFSGVIHHAYVQGMGVIGNYMREETARRPVDYGVNVHFALNSSE